MQKQQDEAYCQAQWGGYENIGADCTLPTPAQKERRKDNLQLINNVICSIMARLVWDQNNEKGQTLVEYGLILALISIAAIAIMGTVGGNIVNVFTAVANQLHS